MSRLEYNKLILQKVSFNQMLFEKELSKAMNHLSREDIIELHFWCTENITYYSSLSIGRYGVLQLKEVKIA